MRFIANNREDSYICHAAFPTGIRIGTDAVQAAMEAVQDYMIKLYESANLVALRGKRITVAPLDMVAVRTIRGEEVMSRDTMDHIMLPPKKFDATMGTASSDIVH